MEGNTNIDMMFGGSFSERIYLPSDDIRDTEEYLKQYIEREFPDTRTAACTPAVYSVPRIFHKMGEQQATLAEHEVFRRLHGLSLDAAGGLWVTFFHSACYAGHSFRNHRVGRLMIREHDFVVFARYRGKHYMALLEVKSTNDHNTNKDGLKLQKVSDAKVIKNNKRTAEHQLRDHMEVLQRLLDINPEENTIQRYIMWPFLGGYTRDPKQQTVKRWKEDEKSHAFEDVFNTQEKFNQWFSENVLDSKAMLEKHFNKLLNRYIILSCGVFVDEINDQMLALLTQEQLQLLNSDVCTRSLGPLVVHGAAGTGKTLLVLRKLEQLHKEGRLNDQNRALYICYWPGIRWEMRMKFKVLGIDAYVDTSRFYISLMDFLQGNAKNYKHIFMDESEALCLALDSRIVWTTLNKLYHKYHQGNCTDSMCAHLQLSHGEDMAAKIKTHPKIDWGELWFMVDINQASMFLPKHSPSMLKAPSITLSKVMRSTGNIFQVFRQFYSVPMPELPKAIRDQITIPSITLGHNIFGPPVYWVPVGGDIASSVANTVIDLSATKGFKPRDLCVIPFLVNEKLVPNCINKCIDEHFVDGFRPTAVDDVEDFLSDRNYNDFLISWGLRVKGLEFKVVIMAIDDDDFDRSDGEDRKKAYTIASRCTCMLILVCNENCIKDFDVDSAIKKYPFSLSL